MTTITKRGRLAFAGVLAAAAIGSAAPAQASAGDKAERCDTRLERIELQFRHLEEKRGWYEAAEWWDHAWASYYKQCLAP
jgi:hypothetical protein